MISPGEALAIVLEKTPRLDVVRLSLTDAVGCVLAENVVSDIDLPPFDKSAMDGFAVRAEDVAKTPVELEIIEDIPAGARPAKSLTPGACARIMTGAPVPEGADAVVMVEDTEAAGERRVRVLKASPGKTNICLRGEDVKSGTQVLAPSMVITPHVAALLASVGRADVAVCRRPTVAVLATGDELVDITDIPGPGQIRNANTWGLLACCNRAGVETTSLGVARDDETDLREKIARGLDSDVLLVSGGVSMGEWDLVPKILDEAGMITHFDCIRQKPGKPTVFATSKRGIVFGLPGNPVATLVGFRLYVRPAIRKMMGHPTPAPAPLVATLANDTRVRGSRLTFVPAVFHHGGATLRVETIETMGSADLVNFARAEALVPLEPGPHDAGTTVDAYPLEI